MRQRVTGKDLQLGDRVRLFDDEFGDGVVTKIEEDGRRSVFRVYLTTADFSYSGGVIPYIGTETVILGENSPVQLLRRVTLR